MGEGGIDGSRKYFLSAPYDNPQIFLDEERARAIKANFHKICKQTNCNNG
jgi:hypothetical protein